MPDITFDSVHLDKIQIGKLRAKWSASGAQILRYYIDFRHIPLDLHKELSAPDIGVLQNKVDSLLAAWDKKYDTHLTSKVTAQGKDLATEMALNADRRRSELKTLLHATLKVDDAVDWESLKSKAVYVKQLFTEPKPPQPRQIPAPTEPKIGFFDKIFGSAKEKRARYHALVDAANKGKDEERAKFERLSNERSRRQHAWDEDQKQKAQAFLAEQNRANALIDEMKGRWLAGDLDTIIEHATLVLERSSLPECVPKNFDLAYQPEAKTLVLHYQLPDPDDLPLTKTVRYIASTGELLETKIAQKEAKDLFDSVCYQLCLRVCHELFEADTPNHVEVIVFNGFTDTVDRATGKNALAIIMSVMTNRKDFLVLDLGRVDPKACFKALKGVAASSLFGLAPIAPIIEIDRSDRRFIDAKSVALDEDGATNLASMHWEDFEHLVRQLFEKEFASRGGEVRVTQASSDGGVDAVAFDPDPITGGKIVIQAKRYTKTVGVSAVRDLYGTLLSEGASKGILITTADFGPDAHKFAAGKPITLLSGANMLHLLHKHGTKAKIDLKEARKELGLT
ncbi:MAG: restriction endonuclease [Pseudorhodobacter sp.]|nr:restriction endonuclease [Pseudorhodobacter sp.]